MAAQFSATHEDATVLIFSSYDTFSRVLNDPKTHGFREIDARKSGGGIWADALHPTTGMHEILERDIFAFLEAVKQTPEETIV